MQHNERIRRETTFHVKQDNELWDQQKKPSSWRWRQLGTEALWNQLKERPAQRVTKFYKHLPDYKSDNPWWFWMGFLYLHRTTGLWLSVTCARNETLPRCSTCLLWAVIICVQLHSMIQLFLWKWGSRSMLNMIGGAISILKGCSTITFPGRKVRKIIMLF